MKYRRIEKTILGDLYTPVGTFMKLRQKYHQLLLLESSDYASKENSQSFICFEELEGIELNGNNLSIYNPNTKHKKEISNHQLIPELKTLISNIEVDQKPAQSGVFGFSTYDSIAYFEDISINLEKSENETPILKYDFYRFNLIFDHFYDKLTVVEYLGEGQESRIEEILDLINYQDNLSFKFDLQGEETSNITDNTFKENVRTAKQHLKRGDIFQVVLSRSFKQSYSGDVFNVYRSLRSVNPSPYLYYFDYGSYRIFGSSPEAELVVADRKAEIHPIAGTFRRTGDINIDLAKAEQLRKDPKENAEHVMLVDLARNDLSKHAKDVVVKKYKETQFFSHVIHLTSVVEGTLSSDEQSIDVFADTFPAGTLSGAPKYKAMQIIDRLEPTKRGFYGGAIGFFSLKGDLNHAILIRSFLAKNNVLRYQAGAGIVIDSDEEMELKEVNNKLAALKSAIQKSTSNG